MENKIFGNQEQFAIEVKDYHPESKRGKIRFWVAGKQLGDLKRVDKISYFIKALNVLVNDSKELYDQLFETMSNEQIFSHCLFLDRDSSAFTKEDYDLVNRMRQTFSLWFGEQLDNVAHVIYFKDKSYHFLWSYNSSYSKAINYIKNLKYEKVLEDDFKNVSLSFLQDFG